MGTVRLAPTADVPVVVLAAARELMDAAFVGGFTDDDWAHALGGRHAWVEGAPGTVTAHAALVPRRMWVGDDQVEVGYVEAVAVHPDLARRGLGGAVMAALEQHAPAYDLLALSSSDEGLVFYAARGWVPWRGPTGVRHPGGDVPTPDEDGSVLVLPGRRGWDGLDLRAPLRREPRSGDDW